MSIAYFDCFSGAAGDMIVGALINAGADGITLQSKLANLGLSGYSLSIESIKKQGIAATRFDVRLDATAKQPHRHLKHIREILLKCDLSEPVRTKALQVFERLAGAEAAVHGTSPEKVHFHEVGAIDAILDVVGAMLALEALGVERVYCSPIPTGSGTVSCEHGVLPIPAPATAELLRGVPLLATDAAGELTTPTGAAVLTTLADRFGPIPPMTIRSIGYGAGQRDGANRPNVLRVMVGDAEPPLTTTNNDTVILLETNLDDATGQVVGHCMERLFADGALDVWAVPIVMKKSRPGVLLGVLCEPAKRQRLEAILFAETTTFGVRRQVMERSILQRRWESVQTRYGAIRMKIGVGPAGETANPEYEDCAAAAAAHCVAVREVMREATAAWQNR